jgi:hypothetical protein
MTTVLIATTVVIALFGVGFGLWTLRQDHGEVEQQRRIDRS